MFEFNAEDLSTNQRGQLSQRQRDWLKIVARSARSSSWTGAVVIISFMLLGLCIIAALNLKNADTRAALFANPMNLLVFPLIVLVIFGVIVLSIALAYWNARKLENATLLSVTGNIRFDESYSSESNIRSYYVFVGKKRFTFGATMSRRRTESGKYKFYHCKPGMYEFVMAFERIDN